MVVTLPRLAISFVAAITATGCQQARGLEDAVQYPTKSITIVCWSNPGSPNDLFARQLAKIGAKHFGQPISVLTKAGANGAAAMAYLTKQPADGYTLSTITSSQTFGMAAGHIPFTPEQFTYLLSVQIDPFVIVVRADSPFQTLKDLIAGAKQRPGKYSVSGFGSASAHFLAFAQLKAAASNPDIRWVAYDGGSDATVAVLGGHADIAHTNYAAVREHIKAGHMRALAVSSPVRLSMLPDVPTYGELGYNVAPIQWRGVMAPAGMSPAIRDRLRDLLLKTINDSEFKAFMHNAGLGFAPAASQEDFQSLVQQEVVSNHQLLRELNLGGAS